MPASPVLVDSSCYIRLPREGRDPLRELAVIAAQLVLTFDRHFDAIPGIRAVSEIV